MNDSSPETVQSHYSALTTHRKCPQHYYYRYDLRIAEPSDRVAPERDFGSWWSVLRAADATERGRKHDSLKQEPRELKSVDDGPRFDQKTITVEEVLEGAEKWWHGHATQPDGAGGFARDQWEERLGGEAPDLLRRLLERHYDQWGENIKQEHPLAVELRWERDLPQPKDAWRPEGYPTMRLTGYVDEVYWDNERGLVVARDHKTTKKLDASSAVDDMMDSQLQLYAWGATPTIVSWGFKRGIRAVAYDRARSIAPKPPSLTKAGKLRVSGGEPATGMTDLKTYLEWVATGPEFEGNKKDGSGAGVYEAEDKVIEKLSTPAAQAMWFQRTQVPLNLNLIRSHLRAAVDSTYDTYVTAQRTERAKEAQRNLGMNCKWCPFASLCRAQMIGGADGTYDLREHGLEGRNGELTLDNGTLA